jgi:hypothetical protein
MSDMFDDGEINQHIIGPDTALVVVDHRGYSALDAVVIDIDRPVSWLISQSLKPTASCSATKISTSSRSEPWFAFQRENVISLLVDDLSRDVALAADRVKSHDRPFDCQHVQKFGRRYDLVGFFGYFDLSKDEPLTRRECRNLVYRHLAVPFLNRSAHGLAIDGDHPRLHTGRRVTQATKQRWELLGIENGQVFRLAAVGTRV